MDKAADPSEEGDAAADSWGWQGLQVKKQILVGAGGQGMRGETESWMGAGGEEAKGDFIALCSSLLGWCSRDRDGLSSEMPSGGTRGTGTKCVHGKLISYSKLLRN